MTLSSVTANTPATPSRVSSLYQIIGTSVANKVGQLFGAAKGYATNSPQIQRSVRLLSEGAKAMAVICLIEQVRAATLLAAGESSGGSALVAGGVMLTHYFGRQLLSTQPIQAALSSLSLQAEVPTSQQWYTWDYFQDPQGGRQLVSMKVGNNTSFLSGLTVKNVPMHILTSLTVTGGSVVAYQNGYAFVGTATGLRVIDVSDPANPSLAAGFDFTDLNNMQGLQIVGNRCYALANPTSNGNVGALVIFDITNPEAPSLVGNPFILDFLPYGDALGISGSYAYIGGLNLGSGAGCIEVIDLSNPASMSVVKSLQLPQTGAITAISCDGPRCYAGAGAGSQLFCILDITTPTSPVVLGSLYTPDTVNSIAGSYPTLLLGTSNGIYRVDITNTSSPNITQTFFPGVIITYLTPALDGAFMVFNTNSLLQKYDISDPTNPVFVSQVAAPFLDVAVTPTNYLLIDGNHGLQVSNLGDTFQVSGTPAGNLGGDYSIQVSSSGASGIQTTSGALSVAPAVTVATPVPPQRAVVGSLFDYNINAFKQVNGSPLTYTATLRGGGSLPSWLTFTTAGSLTGTPTSSGVLELVIVANDAFGGTASTNMTLSIFNSPFVNIPIPNQIATFGNPFSYTAPSDAIQVRGNSELIYTAAQSNGVPLPTWLTQTNLTFNGTATAADSGVISVALTGTDPSTSLQTTAQFQISVVQESPPILQFPIASQTVQTGQEFSIPIPAGMMTSPYTSHITYTVELGDGSPLPSNVNYDPTTGLITGSFDRSYLGWNSDGSVTIKVTGQGIKATQSTTFTITIQGITNGEIAQDAAPPAGTLFATLFAIPELYVLYWNRFKKKEYRTAPVQVRVGEKLATLPLLVEKDQIQKFTTIYKGKPLPDSNHLPPWLEYEVETDTLQTRTVVPEVAAGSTYTIQVWRKCGTWFKHTGRIMQEFDLIVLPREKEDPEAVVASPTLRQRHTTASPDSSDSSHKDSPPSAAMKYKPSQVVPLPSHRRLTPITGASSPGSVAIHVASESAPAAFPASPSVATTEPAQSAPQGEGTT